MKTVDIDEVGGSLARYVEDAKGERVVLTRAGKPAAVITSVEGYDFEDLDIAGDPAFWRLIEERRSQPTLTRAELERSLED